MFLGKIKNFFPHFRKKFIFRVPEKKKYLIHDFQKRFLNSTIKNLDFEKINFREEINVFFILRSILFYKYWRLDFKIAYISSHIDFINPSIILTFTDNDPNFYKLKKYFKNKYFMAIQNGTRSISGDVFSLINKKTKYSADLICCHNKAIAQKYFKTIKLNTVVSGSYLNNETKKENIKKKYDILFISQYDNYSFNEKYFSNYLNKSYNWKEYYNSELEVLKVLDNFCYKKKIKLTICGRLSENIKEEFDFYQKNLKKTQWSFLKNYNKRNSYKIVDQSKLIVFIDSTLGYESIARKNKTVCFAIRGEFLKDKSFNFGWPNNLNLSGPFWTSNFKVKKMKNILRYNYNLGSMKWINNNIKIINKIMVFDQNNSKIKKIFKQF